MCLIFGLLFIYTLFISYESLRENHKRVFLPFIIGTIMVGITILFTNIEIISIGEVTNVRGTTVILGYIYVILLLLPILFWVLLWVFQIRLEIALLDLDRHDLKFGREVLLLFSVFHKHLCFKLIITLKPSAPR